MNRQPPRYPLLHILLGNAFLLSGIYLALGVAVEALRRWTALGWAEEASLVLDRLPARVLLRLGLLHWLRDLYLESKLPGWGLRLVFGGTTVAFIFVLAVGVSVMMWALYGLWKRGVERRAPPPR